MIALLHATITKNKDECSATCNNRKNKCIDRNNYATKRRLLCDMQQSQTHRSSNEMQ